MPIADESPLPATSEARQRSDGPGWSERHRLLAVDDGRAIALAFSVGIRSVASRDAASFHCAVFRAGRPPIVIVDHEIPAPDELLELRASGLWTDNVCETPYVHWSYGLEAFGLAIESSTEMLARGYGDRVPLGWELDFESSPDQVTPIAPSAYSQAGRLEGLVLSADGEAAFSGAAVRQHWWGAGAERDLVVDQLDALVDLATGELGTVVEVALPLGPVGSPPPPTWWVSAAGRRLRSRLER